MSTNEARNFKPFEMNSPYWPSPMPGSRQSISPTGASPSITPSSSGDSVAQNDAFLKDHILGAMKNNPPKMHDFFADNNGYNWGPSSGSQVQGSPETSWGHSTRELSPEIQDPSRKESEKDVKIQELEKKLLDLNMEKSSLGFQIPQFTRQLWMMKAEVAAKDATISKFEDQLSKQEVTQLENLRHMTKAIVDKDVIMDQLTEELQQREEETVAWMTRALELGACSGKVSPSAKNVEIEESSSSGKSDGEDVKLSSQIKTLESQLQERKDELAAKDEEIKMKDVQLQDIEKKFEAHQEERLANLRTVMALKQSLADKEAWAASEIAANMLEMKRKEDHIQGLYKHIYMRSEEQTKQADFKRSEQRAAEEHIAELQKKLDVKGKITKELENIVYQKGILVSHGEGMMAGKDKIIEEQARLIEHLKETLESLQSDKLRDLEVLAGGCERDV